MLKAFYRIDLFGKAVLFNYQGNSKSKSKIGALFTVILFAFVIWVTIYFGQQILNKKDPKATSFESYNDNPAATPFTIDNFAFGIGMSDPITFANYINESIYTISATTYKTTRTPQPDGTVKIDYERLPLELERCRTDHFGELSEKFSYVALDQLFCLKKEQSRLNNSSPTLEGNFESPVFQGIIIEFQECNRNTSAICGTQEEVDALLGGGLLSLVFSNVAVDLTNSEKPLQKFRDNFYTTIGNSYSKEINLYLEQLDINTDNGWLTSEFQTENYIKYGDITEMFSLTRKSSYATFNIRLNNVKKHFNRSYTKIQEVIAQVNGTVAVTFTILFFLIAPYVRLKFYEALINEIFDIKTSKRNPKDLKANRKSRPSKPKSRDEDQKESPNLSPNRPTIPSKTDLEQQRSPSELHTDPIFTQRIESTERGETDDINLIKRIPTLEEPPSLQRQSLQIIKPNITNNKKNEAKLKISFAQSRGVPRTPLIFSALNSENRQETNSDIISPLSSPIDSKRERILLSRKPTFSKPDFKILDYEEHGQDLFEDILKNIKPSEKRPDNAIANEFAISEIRKEESEEDDFSQIEEEIQKDQKEVDLSLKEIQITSEKEEKQKQKQEQKRKRKKGERKEAHAKYKLQRLDLITSKNMDEINLSFCEYVRSYFSKSTVIKEKISILDQGIKRINERLDIFNIFKKLREFDKLKVLLLENEQFVLFDSLPKPELSLRERDESPNITVLSQKKIKDPQFIQDKIKKDLILLSYENLKRKSTSTMLDKKLFEIYDDFLCLKP